MSVHACYALMGTCRWQKMMSDLLKLHVFVSLFFTWVLGTELESSRKTIKACNLLAISLPLFYISLDGCLSTCGPTLLQTLMV